MKWYSRRPYKKGSWRSRQPSLQTVILEAVQAALKGAGIKHPDSTRTQRAKQQGRARKQQRS